MSYASTTPLLERHWRLGYIGFAAVIALLSNIFFWDVALGLGFFLFVLLYVVGFVSLAVCTKQLREPRAFALLIPIIILSADVVLYNNALVRIWVPIFVFALLVLFSLLSTLQNPHRYRFSLSKIPLFRDIDVLFRKWGNVFHDLFTWKKGADGAVIKKIALGLGLSLPIMFIFGSLLAEADAIFGDIISRSVDLHIDGNIVWRLFRSGVTTLFLSGFFYVLIQDNVLGEKKERAIKLDATVVGTILVLVNVLFLFFVAVQFKYLFGSYEYVRANDIVFAEHARSGFFQLAWVVGLAAAMLVFMYRSAVHHGYSLLLQVLKGVFIGLVLVIAYSALHRMGLYQDAYGFTVLRLYVQWTICFAMLLLLFAGGAIVTKLPFRNFFYTTLLLGIGALTVVCSINVDRMIARENIDRHLLQGKKVDVRYLVEELSFDAVPEVDRLFAATPSQQVIGHGTVTYAVYPSLYTRYDKGIETLWYDAERSWREFNFGYDRAKDVLLQHPWIRAE